MATLKSICLLVLIHLISNLESMPSPVQMPASCNGAKYCFEKSPDYPQEELEAIWADLNIRSVNEPVEIGHREGEGQVCPSYKRLAPIYEIVDEEGDVRFVAQIENKFIQNYTITECVKKGRILDEGAVFTKTLLEEFNVMCVDTMSSPKFLVITHDKKNVEVVLADGGVPMGCACRYEVI